jgi:hypothetical protein
VPVWPTLLLFAAIGISQVVKGFARNGMTEKARTIFFSVVASVAVINSTVSSLTEDIRFISPDTRISSSGKLNAIGATEANTIFEGYTPLSPTQSGTIFDRFSDPFTDPRPIDTSKKYILISDCVSGIYQDSSRFPNQKAFYDLLRTNYRQVWQVKKDVGQLQQIAFEPINVTSRLMSAGKLLSGGQTGCELALFRTGRQ